MIQHGNKGDLADVKKKVKIKDMKPFSVGMVHLYRSELRPDGAVYTKIKTFPLGEK